MRRRTYITVAAALVAASGALALLIGGGSGEADERQTAAAIPPPPEAEADADPADNRLELAHPDGARPIIWVRRGERVEVRTEPGGGEVAEVLRRETEFGSPTVLAVFEQRGRWAGVSTPALANDRIGWVRLDARRLRAGWTEQSIVVSLSARQATLYEGEEAMRSFTVTVGSPDAPTPTGDFAVTDTFRGSLNPAYGCCAVAISAIQPHVPSGWLGGNRIAFHGNGTGEPLGAAISNGCLRAADDDVDALVSEVGLGVPVFIRE